jgi:ribonuclease HII
MVNLKKEKEIQKKGYKIVVGLDEAGRGPLAGPVVASAVFVASSFQYNSSFEKINDSKKLSAKQRDGFYNLLTNNPGIKWGIGMVSEKTIDRINILEATKLAMLKAIEDLGLKLNKASIDYLILDGNFFIDSSIRQEAVIGADGKIFSCMAAGIIAKVTRDRLMDKYHIKYPKYGFDKHKGYGTEAHYQAIEENGICPLHRKSFRLLKKK